jgi:hypothetical protein
VSIDLAAEADSVIWTARLRTGRVVTFRASVSRAFKVGVLIEAVAEEDSAVIASVAGDSVAAEIALEDSVAAVVFVVVGDDEN